MQNNLSVVQRFDAVRESLKKEPNVKYTTILESVKSIFRDFKYEKRYYTHSIKGLLRASQNVDENWFDCQGKFSYRPKNITNNRFGRCDCPDEPVFYCSNENIVSVMA